MTERSFNEPTPKTFIGAIGEIVDFVVVEAVREETARERADRIWRMPAQEEPAQ